MNECCQCLDVTTTCCVVCVFCTDNSFIADKQPSGVRQRCAYQCLFFSMGVTLFVLSLLSYKNFSSSFDNYEMILENWKSDPIVSIRIATQCNSNEKNVIHYGWPGTVGACDCRGYNPWTITLSSFRPRDIIYTNHVCNSTQLAYDCHTIEPISAIEFDEFPTPNTSKRFQLCAITQANNSFNLVTDQESCGQNQTQCGSDPEYQYCSNSNICPITTIGFTTPAPSASEKQDFMWVMRNENKLPLVEFRIAEGGVCMHNHQRAITSGRSDYFLMDGIRTDCSRDPRFTLLESVPEPIYFQANDQLGLPSKLPNFVLSPEYSWGLYDRGYIPWSKSCRGPLMQKFMAAEGDYEDIIKCQKNLLIVSSVFLGVISIVMTVFSVGNLIGYDWICIPGSGTKESDIIFGTEVFFKLVLQAVQAYFIGSSWKIVKSQMDFLDSLQTTNCSDDFTMSIIRDLNDQLQEKVYSYNLAYLIIFLVSTLIDIIVASSYFRKRVQFYNSLSVTQKNNDQEMNNVQAQPNIDINQVGDPMYVNQNVYPNNQFQNPDQINQYPIVGNQDTPYIQQQPYQNPISNNYNQYPAPDNSGYPQQQGYPYQQGYQMADPYNPYTVPINQEYPQGYQNPNIQPNGPPPPQGKW